MNDATVSLWKSAEPHVFGDFERTADILSDRTLHAAMRAVSTSDERRSGISQPGRWLAGDSVHRLQLPESFDGFTYQTVLEHVARFVNAKQLSFVGSDVHRYSPAIYRTASEILKRHLAHDERAPEVVNTSILYGSADSMRVGIHKGSAATFQLILRGTRRYCSWPFAALSRLAPSALAFADYTIEGLAATDPGIPEGKVQEVHAGDVIFLPASNWHYSPAGDNASVVLSVSCYPPAALRGKESTTAKCTVNPSDSHNNAAKAASRAVHDSCQRSRWWLKGPFEWGKKAAIDKLPEKIALATPIRYFVTNNANVNIVTCEGKAFCADPCVNLPSALQVLSENSEVYVSELTDKLGKIAHDLVSHLIMAQAVRPL
jgi:hypothetical protein